LALKDLDYHIEFTGELAQKLEPWENPEWKLPALYEALGVDNGREAALVLARLFVDGFKTKPRRRRPGRRDVLSIVFDSTESVLSNILIPGFIRADFEERLFRRMEAILAAAAKNGRPMKVLGAAAQVIAEVEIDGQSNPFHVGRSVAREEREAIEKSVVQLFIHRKRRRTQHEEMRRPFLEGMKQEVEQRLKPHWVEIYEELRQRLIKESEERHAAGEDLEEILADIPNRMLVVGMEITARYF
jgi:hypothetical protein